MKVVSILLLCLLELSVDACPNGWLGHGASCYLFSHDRETWTGAYDMCKILGSNLVEIDDKAENDYLVSQVSLKGINYWMGLSDVSEEGTWQWMFSKSSLTAETFSNWHPNEPSTTDSNKQLENCGIFYPTGKWNDAVCNTVEFYICESQNEQPVIG